MALTQADLDAINKAIASGVLRVKFADREVEYRSMAELKDAKAEILKALKPSRDEYSVPCFNKGTT